MSQFIEFVMVEKKPKTKMYAVKKITAHPFMGDILGFIKWYGSWKQYCFFPEPNTTFNIDCMSYIIEFIKDLMEERKHE